MRFFLFFFLSLTNYLAFSTARYDELHFFVQNSHSLSEFAERQKHSLDKIEQFIELGQGIDSNNVYFPTHDIVLLKSFLKDVKSDTKLGYLLSDSAEFCGAVMESIDELESFKAVIQNAFFNAHLSLVNGQSTRDSTQLNLLQGVNFLSQRMRLLENTSDQKDLAKSLLRLKSDSQIMELITEIRNETSFSSIQHQLLCESILRLSTYSVEGDQSFFVAQIESFEDYYNDYLDVFVQKQIETVVAKNKGLLMLYNSFLEQNNVSTNYFNEIVAFSRHCFDRVRWVMSLFAERNYDSLNEDDVLPIVSSLYRTLSNGLTSDTMSVEALVGQLPQNAFNKLLSLSKEEELSFLINLYDEFLPGLKTTLNEALMTFDSKTVIQFFSGPLKSELSKSMAQIKSNLRGLSSWEKENEWWPIAYNLVPTAVKMHEGRPSLDYRIDLDVGGKSYVPGILIPDVPMDSSFFEFVNLKSEEVFSEIVSSFPARLISEDFEFWLDRVGFSKEQLVLPDTLFDLLNGIEFSYMGECVRLNLFDENSQGNCVGLDVTEITVRTNAVEEKLNKILTKILEQAYVDISKEITEWLRIDSVAYSQLNFIETLDRVYLENDNIIALISMGKVEDELEGGFFRAEVSLDGKLNKVTPHMRERRVFQNLLSRFPMLYVDSVHENGAVHKVYLNMWSRSFYIGILRLHRGDLLLDGVDIDREYELIDDVFFNVAYAGLDLESGIVKLEVRGVKSPYFDFNISNFFDVEILLNSESPSIQINSVQVNDRLLGRLNTFIHKKMFMPKQVHVIDFLITQNCFDLDVRFKDEDMGEISAFTSQIKGIVKALSRENVELFLESELISFKSELENYFFSKYGSFYFALSALLNGDLGKDGFKKIADSLDFYEVQMSEDLYFEWEYDDKKISIVFNHRTINCDTKSDLLRMEVYYDDLNVKLLPNYHCLREWFLQLAQIEVEDFLDLSDFLVYWEGANKSIVLEIPLVYGGFQYPIALMINLNGEVVWDRKGFNDQLQALLKQKLRQEGKVLLQSYEERAIARLKDLFSLANVTVTNSSFYTPEEDDFPTHLKLSIAASMMSDVNIYVDDIFFSLSDFTLNFDNIYVYFSELTQLIEKEIENRYVHDVRFDYIRNEYLGYIEVLGVFDGFLTEESAPFPFRIQLDLSNFQGKIDLLKQDLYNYLEVYLNNNLLPRSLEFSDFDLLISRFSFDVPKMLIYGEVTYSNEFDISTGFVATVNVETGASSFDFELDWKDLIDPGLLLSQIDYNLIENEFFSIDAEFSLNKKGYFLPNGVAAEISGAIFGLKLKFPKILINKQGAHIEDWEKVSVGVPDEYSVPIPCCFKMNNFELAYEKKEFIFSGDLSLAAEKSELILKQNGRFYFNLSHPLRWKSESRMLFLTTIQLGSSSQVIDLKKGVLSGEVNFGEAFPNIIDLKGRYEINGHDQLLSASGDLKVFDSRLAQARAKLDLKDGSLKATGKLEIANSFTLTGDLRTTENFSNPSFTGSTKLGVSSIVNVSKVEVAIYEDYSAYVNVNLVDLADVGFSLEDYRLLNADVVLEFLKSMFGNALDNLKDLDKGFDALLKGNVHVDPLAKFGKEKGGKDRETTTMNSRVQSVRKRGQKRSNVNTGRGQEKTTITTVISQSSGRQISEAIKRLPGPEKTIGTLLNKEKSNQQRRDFHNAPPLTKPSGPAPSMDISGGGIAYSVFGDDPCKSGSQAIQNNGSGLALYRDGQLSTFLDPKFFIGNQLLSEHVRINPCDNGFSFLSRDELNMLYGHDPNNITLNRIPLSHLGVTRSQLLERSLIPNQKWRLLTAFFSALTVKCSQGVVYDDAFQLKFFSVNSKGIEGCIFKFKDSNDFTIIMVENGSETPRQISINNPGDPVDLNFISTYIKTIF